MIFHNSVRMMLYQYSINSKLFTFEGNDSYDMLVVHCVYILDLFTDLLYRSLMMERHHIPLHSLKKISLRTLIVTSLMIIVSTNR